MSDTPLEQIGKVFIDLIKAKNQQMANAFLQKGGWEGWLQVELANSLNAVFPGQITVQREETGPFQGNQRVDILVTPALGRPIAIELKTESIFQSANRAPIGALALGDYEKIEGFGKRSQYQFLQFALSVSEPGAISLRDFSNFAKGKLLIVDSVHADTLPIPNLDFLEIVLCVVVYKTS